MRSKGEILKNLPDWSAGVEVNKNAVQVATLEVLIDIRDELAKSNEVEISGPAEPPKINLNS